MKELEKYRWKILVAVVSMAIVFVVRDQNTKTPAFSTNKNLETYSNHFRQSQPSIRNYEKEFYCKNTSNVGKTECLIEQLDRASAIREWKQRKIESLKYPEVNTSELGSLLLEETEKIKRWRLGFEDARDNGCIARWSFRGGGSGVPGRTAECELNYEISALETLDWIYYETILEGVDDSQGIPDFEPTEKDIERLIESNKTVRGCIWADDPTCE